MVAPIPFYKTKYTNKFIEVSVYEIGYNDDNIPITFEYLAAEDSDGHEIARSLAAIHLGHREPRRVQISPLKDN